MRTRRPVLRSSPHWARRLWSRGKRLAPLVVWCGAAALAWRLYGGRALEVGLPGVVEVPRHEVGSAEPGTLAELRVAPGQAVAAGEVLGRLDDRVLVAEQELARARLRAEIQALDAEAGVEAAEIRELLEAPDEGAGKLWQIDRQFERDAQEAALALEELRLREARQHAELSVARTELARLEDLLAEGLVVEDKVRLFRLQQGALAGYVERMAPLEAALREALEDAQARREGWRAWLAWHAGAATQQADLPEEASACATKTLADPEGTPLRAKSISVRQWAFRAELLERRQEAYRLKRAGLVAQAEKEDALWEVRREACLLRAPRAGTVAEVLRRPGAALAGAEPVLTLVEHAAPRVVAFVPEDQQESWVPGRTVALLVPASGSEPAGALRTLLARVETRAPCVETLPAPASLTPAVPVRGLRVRLEPLAPAPLLPGQGVRVLPAGAAQE